MLHISACAWVFLEFYNEEKAVEIAQWKSDTLESMTTYGHTGEFLWQGHKRYIDAVYFMTTTMTTVGYGDIKGLNIYE